MHSVAGDRPTLEDLVARARAGDHGAFDVLARLASHRLYAVALRILRDGPSAEDAVQETLIETWRNLRALRDPERFDAWSTRILVRVCYREARRSRATIKLEDDLAPPGRDPLGSLLDRDQLERGFRHLTVEQRTILVLRHYLGMEPMEIADTLAIPVGTARSRLHYAHQALRAALDAESRRPSIEVIQ